MPMGYPGRDIIRQLALAYYFLEERSKMKTEFGGNYQVYVVFNALD